MTSESGPRSTTEAAPRLLYQPALDGLRAIAVISVLLYHANLAWIPGGFLGVEMFFVISGYLITSLLLAEWDQHGRVDFKNFWLRRARRLFPALFLLLVVVVGFAVVFLPTEVAGLRGDALSTAGYVNNWYQVFSHKSYFESAGRPSLLRHMWSLAVEEQFYLFWPILFSVLMSRLRPRLLLMLVLAGAGASIALMASMYQPNVDPSRIYYGTDTRASGLLLGVALAFVWRPGQTSSEASTLVLDAAGLAACAVIAACFLFVNEFQAFLYRGGFSVAGLATAELIAVAVHPRARLVPRVLSWSPLRWVGLRSYGIYLWHFPVFMVTRPQLDVPLDGVPLLAVRFALTLLIAELSYRWVETPIRHDALGRLWKKWREAQGREKRRLGLRWVAASLFIVAISATLGIALLQARPPAPPEYLAHASAKAPAITQSNLAPPTAQSANSVTQWLVQAASSVATGAPPVNIPPPPPDGPRPWASQTPMIEIRNTADVTAIGDSVIEGVADELKKVFGTNLIVNADQGRLPWNTPAIVRHLHAQGKIQPLVILHIGNNGFFSAEMFGQIMIELKDARRVVVVNVKAPRRWETINNQMLATAVRSYPNAVLMDWHGASADRPKIFWKDGIHVRPEGAKVYAELIVQAVGAADSHVR